MSGSATLATERFRFATPATAISDSRTIFSRSGTVDCSAGSASAGVATTRASTRAARARITRPGRCEPGRRARTLPRTMALLPPSGRQYELRHGDQRAVVVEVGGGLRLYEVGGRPVLDAYAEDAM